MSPPSEPIGGKKLEIEQLDTALKQLGRIETTIANEFGLISARMTWLVISESFIFSAFATAVSGFRPEHQLANVLRLLILVLPGVGILLAVSVYLAILAAHLAARNLKQTRERIEPLLPLPKEFEVAMFASGSGVDVCGNVPSYFIPPFLAAVWFLVYAWLLISGHLFA